MRTTTRLIASLAFSAVPALAQAPFEGVLTVQMRGEGRTQDLQYLVRQGLARIEMGGPRGQMAMVMDPKKQTMLMLIPERKMYMEQSLAASKPTVSKDGPKKVAEVVRTGRMETIAGVQCEHVTITGETGSSDACMAQSLGAFPGMGGGGMGPGAGRRTTGASWRSELDGKGMGFPLKVTHDGETVWEVTKIEKKPLDAALFAAPARWTQVPMMGAPGGRPPR